MGFRQFLNAFKKQTNDTTFPLVPKLRLATGSEELPSEHFQLAGSSLTKPQPDIKHAPFSHSAFDFYPPFVHLSNMTAN